MSEKFRGVNPEVQREPQRMKADKESVRTRSDVLDSEERVDIRLTAGQLAAMEEPRRAEARREAEHLRMALRSRAPHTPAEGEVNRTDMHAVLEVRLHRLDAGLAVDGSKRSLWEKAGDWWSGRRKMMEQKMARDVRDTVRDYGERHPDAEQDVDRIQSVEQARAAMEQIRRHKESIRK